MLHRLGEITGQLSKSGDEKIPKAMSLQAFTRIEAVLKKPGQRGFVLG